MDWINPIRDILSDLGIFVILMIVGYLAQLFKGTLRLSNSKVIQDAEIIRRFEVLFTDLKDLRRDIGLWKDLHQKETATMELLLTSRIGKVEQAQALEEQEHALEEKTTQ